ncbi:VanZ family protein [Mesobacillus zeae]|uniref:VanZ family protein n=1 Tax=Mesobacillus zeae TaxID=1917180 RepID=UPI00300A95D0
MKTAFKVIINLSFIIYLFILAVILFLGSRGYLRADMSLLEYIKNSSNIVPFKTISIYMRAIFDGGMNADIPIKNLVGNFILFLPMGVYLPYFFKRIDRITFFSMAMCVLVFSIEVIQLVTRRGSFDIDDFILNMLGAWLGLRIWKTRFFQRLLKQQSEQQLPLQ